MIKFSLIRPKVLTHQPTRRQFEQWLKASLVSKYGNVMLTISIVDLATSQCLNLEYRAQDKPTNVISLEYAESREQFNFLSGELILCDEIIQAEAAVQYKSIIAHYAHMLVHGVLHLQGYDHQTDATSEEMEQLEIKILAKLGFANPYTNFNPNLNPDSSL